MDAFDPFASDVEDQDDFLFAAAAAATTHHDEEKGHHHHHHHPPPFDQDEHDDEDGSSASSSYTDYGSEGEDDSGRGGDGNGQDVFGDALGDVDIWGESEDENPFARAEVKNNLGFDFSEEFSTQRSKHTNHHSNDKDVGKLKRRSIKRSGGAGDGGDTATNSSSTGRSKSSDGKHRSSAKSSSSRKGAPRSKSIDGPGMYMPELASHGLGRPPQAQKRSSHSKSSRSNRSRSRHGPSRSKSSPIPQEDSKDRVGELMGLLKLENEGKKSNEASSSRKHTSRSSSNSRGADEGGERKRMSLREEMERELKHLSPARRGNKKSSGKREGSKTFEDSFRSLDERGSDRRHRSGGRRPSRHKSSKNDDEEDGVDTTSGLDSFMKSTRTRSSRRGDGEHRSVVSAPPEQTSASELSQRCQKLNLNF